MAMFWIGLVLGAILSLLTYILVNIYNDRIENVSAGRRRIILRKTLKAELKTYQLVKGLIQGRAEAYMHLITTHIGIVMLSLTAIMSALFAVIISPPDESLFAKLFFTMIRLVFMQLSAFTFWRATSLWGRLIALQPKASRFEEYEKALVEKWGDIREDADHG